MMFLTVLTSVGLVGAQATLPAAATAKFSRLTSAPNSCQVAVGSTNDRGANQIIQIDGATLKKVSDIRSLRNKSGNRAILIEGGDFSGAKFGGDTLSNICFRGTRLINTRWSKTNAPGIGFINVDLTGASFDRVNFDYVLFRNTALGGVDATGARMNYGRLDGGWDPSMAGFRLDNAQLVGFQFACGTTASNGCSFDRKQISMRGTNLSGASLASFSIWDAVVDDALLDQTEINIDQVTQFSTANIAGPVFLRIDGKRISLAPESFRAAGRAIETAKLKDTGCSSADTPLAQIFCQAGQSDLRALRDDTDRLNDAVFGRERRTADGSTVTVTAPNAAHQKYLTALKKCALLEGEDAIACLAKNIAKRRAVLLGDVMKTQPLESDARALYVSAQTPLALLVANDARLAGLTPLLFDTSPHLLLVYRDEDNKLIGRGLGQGDNGQRCVTTFGSPSIKPSKRAPVGPSFAAWSTGAEFTIATIATIKKKKIRKKNNIAAEAVIEAIPGCGAIIKSGPLVRVPISEDEFDRIWKGPKQVS
jgi:uncharacterized protein YjbI with pentapeptide repeats